MEYDLEERTAKFGEEIIRFCRGLPQDIIVRPLINQIIKSATSIGANYLEATAASSKRDFINKIFICKKEAQETRHWLRMIITSSPNHQSAANELLKECKELVLIFQKITASARKNLKIEN